MNFQEDYDALREHAIFGIFDIDNSRKSGLKKLIRAADFYFFWSLDFGSKGSHLHYKC